MPRHRPDLILPVALSLLLAPSMPWAADVKVDTPADIGEVKTLEEVVVTGKLDSLSAIRTAVIEAEDRFHARYNELNQDDEFDVVCTEAAPIGTRLRTRRCVPRFVDILQEQIADDLTSTTSAERNLMVSPGNARLVAQTELRRRMRQLAASDPALLRALLEHARLEQIYQELRSRKLEGKVAVWD